MSAHLLKIFRYPIKALSAESLDAVELAAGAGLPHDRRFAIVRRQPGVGPSGMAPLTRANLFTLAYHERLGALETRFDPETGVLAIQRNGRQVVRGQISTPMGRILIDQFLAAYLKDEAPGMPHLVQTSGKPFTDLPHPGVSIVNQASIADLEHRITQAPVDVRRFRANLVVDGVPPWEESKWPGRRLRIGPALLEVTASIQRCAATMVAPGTGTRDLNIPNELVRGTGRNACGVHARVLVGGPIAPGDPVEIED
ncbi:MAG TPA: MOSC domain-containing protein [Arenibaculum sp.]|nr:MOSC domain-containing protein [Arenibaculum sp.]